MDTTTTDAMYADIRYAKLMLRQSTGTEDRIHWRSEIGRLTQAIRKAEMEVQP